MNLHQAKRDLFDRSFLLGGIRQRRALKYLAACPDVEAVEVLAEALVKGHPRSGAVRSILLGLTAHADQPKIDRLWQSWLKDRRELLGRLVVELGMPSAADEARVVSMWKLGRVVSLKAERRVVRAALRWLADRDPDIRRGLFKTVEQLPNDEQLNDEIVEAWLKHESSELETLISRQGRKPARTELEALFYLVTGQAKAYQALQDDRGEYFLQAFLLAPAGFRQRINETVVKSGNARLVEIYNRAMAGREGFDPQLYREALKKAGDEDRLFESLREIKLLEALELCRRWADSGELPTNDRRRQAAQRAVNAYRGLGQVTFEEGPTPPGGLRDLFAVWKQQSVSDDQRRQDAKAADPLLRARALYLAQGPTGANDPQGGQAATSDDWPVRLVARLLNPALAAADDHVQWVGALSGVDPDILDAPLAGTPVDYTRYSDRLAQARRGGPAAERSARFLEILCAFQGAFVSGDISLEATREATEAKAIDVSEDAPLE